MKRLLVLFLFTGCSDRESVNPSAEAVSGLTMPACGTALAGFDGTTAYSNGADTSTGYSCAGSGAYGYRYQCVELVMRHFTTHWGLRWYGNARDLLNWAPRDKVDVFYNGDAAHPPVAGDMVVWEVGTYGHVALVTSVSATQVAVIEQNVYGNGTALLPYDGARIGARWTNWVPAGWAHAKANGGTSSPPSWNCADSAWGSAQLWTCSGGALHKCDSGGAPVTQSCDHGCYARSAGEDDLCISNVSGWNCASSAYAGQQWWTCSSGSIYRCENGVPEVVRCPSGCVVHALGTNDACY
jgi:CHAP domain